MNEKNKQKTENKKLERLWEEQCCWDPWVAFSQNPASKLSATPSALVGGRWTAQLFPAKSWSLGTWLVQWREGDGLFPQVSCTGHNFDLNQG